MPVRRIEPPVGARPFHKYPRRRESASKTNVQYPQLLHHGLQAERVHVPEGTTEEGGEADPEHRAHVAVAGGAEHSLLQAAGRLVDHGEHGALPDLLRLHLATGRPVRHELVYGWIHPALLAVLV